MCGMARTTELGSKLSVAVWKKYKYKYTDLIFQNVHVQ